MSVFVCRGLVLFILLWCSTSKAIDVDSKLDFGSSSHSGFISENAIHKKTLTPPKVTKTVTLLNPTYKNENSPLICGTGGCNRTDASEKIQTDVLVHIETKLDLNRDQPTKQIIGETPDIPVVVGYKGAKLDRTADEMGGVLVPKPTYPVTGTGYGPPENNIKRNFYNSPIGGGFSTNFPMKPVFMPSTSSSFYGYRPLDSSNSLYNRDVNVNIKTLTPVAVSVSTDEEMYPVHIKYRNNGTRITVPYFEPSFHSHYYGETPPPQHLWYPKSSSSINNVEFKTTKPTWSPPQWYRQGNHRHSVTNDGQGSRCFCQGGSDRSGMGWYPSFTRSLTSTPVKHIDDKLAPLN